MTMTLVDMFVFIFGAIVGSFLNVCIVRLPLEQSIIRPGSHCLKCKKPVLWYDNIPLVSYLLLKGKCRHCGEKYSIRYFLVELLTAVLFLVFYRYFGATPVLPAYLVMLSGFIVATFVDLEHRIIPDEVSIGGMGIGLVFSAFIPEMHGIRVMSDAGIWPYVTSFFYSLTGLLVGGGSIYLMALLGDFLFKKESMGGGDVKLMAMVGAFLGWKAAVLAFFIAPFFGAVYGGIEWIRTRDNTMAYGPFLVLGSLISMFWGRQIISWIINGYSFQNFP